MPNLISNATGMDGVAGWTGGSSIDETILGAPGRAVIVGAGGSLTSAVVNVTPGTSIDVFATYAAAAGGALLECVFSTGAVAIPLKSRGDGRPRRGLPRAFDIARGRLTVPAGAATARLRVTGGGAVYLTKPFLGPAPADRESMWQAGPHANADLNLPAFPSELPPPSVDASPIAQRKAFAGDAGVPITRRIGSSPRVTANLTYELTLEERDTLDQLYRSAAEPFWFTRIDTMELCRARWLADGEPTDSGTRPGIDRTTRIGLLLEVA